MYRLVANMLSCFSSIKSTDIVADIEPCNKKSLPLTDLGQLSVKKHSRHSFSSNTVTRPSNASSEQTISLDRQEIYLPPRSHALLAQHDSDWRQLKSSSTADIISDDVSVAVLAPSLSSNPARRVRDLRCIYASSNLRELIGISQADEYPRLLIDAIDAGDELLDFFLDRAIQALFQSTMKVDRMRKCIATAPGPLEGILLELELCRWTHEDNTLQPLQGTLANFQPALLIRHIPMNRKALPDCNKVAPSLLAAGLTETLPALITLCDLQGQTVLYQVLTVVGKSWKSWLIYYQ